MKCDMKLRNDFFFLVIFVIFWHYKALLQVDTSCSLNSRNIVFFCSLLLSVRSNKSLGKKRGANTCLFLLCQLLSPIYQFPFTCRAFV